MRQKEHYTLPADAAVASEPRFRCNHRRTISALYETVLPGLVRRYEAYISGTDSILDEPTIVIMERIVADLKRQSAQAHSLLRELGMVAATQGQLSLEESRLPHLAQTGANA